MGTLKALEMAELVADGTATLEIALSYHLQNNHYPPVPVSMIPACIAAIAAFKQGDYNRAIALPDGVSYRGQDEAPASAIVEAHHLDAFIEQEEE